MYITPTVIGLANGSPVLPSYNVCFPSGDNPASCNNSSISLSDANHLKANSQKFCAKQI